MEINDASRKKTLKTNAGVRGLITHCLLLILIQRLGRGKQRQREGRTCVLSWGGLDPLEQSGDPDKDSKVATFQRDTLRMETMQRVSR